MASGSTLAVFTPHQNQPPASNYATLDVRNSNLVLDFNDSADESAVFPGVLPANYAGGGITVTLVWAATSAVAGDVVWEASFERHQDETDDLDADSFAAAQTATATAPGTSAGRVQYTDIPFTNGAQMDSLAINESFRLKITRNADDAADTMVGDAELLRVLVKET